MHLWFSSYWCLKVFQLLGSQKLCFSIFVWLKELKKVSKKQNISIQNPLSHRELLLNFKKNPNILYAFYLGFDLLAPCDHLCASSHPSSFEQQHPKNFESNHCFHNNILKRIFNKPSLNIPTDWFCTCGSQVIGVSNFSSYWNRN